MDGRLLIHALVTCDEQQGSLYTPRASARLFPNAPTYLHRKGATKKVVEERSRKGSSVAACQK